MSSDTSRWEQISTLFVELAALPAAARPERLAQITDADLRDEVRSLLDADAAANASGERRFERAPILDAFEAERATANEPLAPNMVGAWRVVRHLGAGGMGTVYEAVRDDTGFTKRAALKMIQARSAMSTALVQRFEAERRILAGLSHRNIATLIDGGVHTDGRPWFALEYVDGAPLVTWCAERALDARACVQLMRQACSAVQYAHEHLVIHRDLKPANMLVDQDGTLKLLDFGIARLMDDREAPLTEAGASPMTGAYASPEQLAGRTLTTATDVWSLGVVLYELLAGVRPDVKAAHAGRLLPPSRCVTDGGALHRRSEGLRAELDAIVTMCLRVEPARRYASVAELGKDLQRWLEGRPVLARPDSWGYRTRLLMRRNRLATLSALAAVLALVSGTLVSVQQARIARAERDRARREQVRTQRVAEFFRTVFTQAAPREGGRALTVSEALRGAIPVIDTAFSAEPDIKAGVQLSIGSTLQNLEQFDVARPLLEQAYAYFRAHDGPVASRDQTDALWDIAALARQDGKLAEAESLFSRLADTYRQPGYGPNESALAKLRIAGIRADAGDLKGAVAIYDSLVPLLRVASRTDSLDYAANVGSRGVALASLGDLPRAVRDLRASLAISDALLGPDSFAAGQVLQPYAGALLFSGQIAEAERVARRGLTIAARSFGDRAAGTQAAMRMLATTLVSAGRCREAIQLFSAILAQRGPALSDRDPSVGYSLVHRGYCRSQLNDVRGGIADAREGLRLSVAALGAQHYATHLAQSLAGATIARGGGALRAEGRRLLEAGANGLRATLQTGHLRITEAEARLRAVPPA